MDEQQNKDQFRSVVSRLADVWNVIAAMVACSFGGYYIGKKMGDEATGALIGAFIGLVYVAYLVWQAFKKSNTK